MLTNFNNSSTVTFSDELQKKLEQNLLLHLKSAAALPCKTFIEVIAKLKQGYHFFGTLYVPDVGTK